MVNGIWPGRETDEERRIRLGELKITHIIIGDKIQTPRFLTVRIAAVFESRELATNCGFSEPTHYNANPEYDIAGKSIGENRMLFAAFRK